ncbi:MAG: hypothetical protein FP831_19430 [Anaerolineae bacterium]|nr:hypothetical protein [Anaerolineae bacterium]
MKKILVIGLTTILIAFFGITGFLALRQEVPISKVGQLQAHIYNPVLNSAGQVDLTVIMAGGKLSVTPNNALTTSVNVQSNVQDWTPQQSAADGIVIEQSSRPKNNWQQVDYIVNDWQVLPGQNPLDLKIDARIWSGTLDLTGVNLQSFQLADLNSQSEIRFDNPSVLFDTFVIDSVRSNMKIFGLLNSGAKNVIFTIPFGNYLVDFTGDLQQDMSAAITTGMGKTRIEIADTANVQITYLGQTRNATIEGNWSRTEGTTYIHSNPGYLLDIVINSDQGDLEVVLVK